MDMENEKQQEGNFFTSKTIKILSIAVLAIIIVLGASFSIYKNEQNKLLYNINNNIKNLNSTITGFNHGLNSNEAALNPSFATNYQANFANIEASFKKDAGNILNTNQTQSIIAKEVAKAQYYSYISQFVGQAASYKDDFTPLVNALNNGGKITASQQTQMENDLNNLENSNALTEAMNLYNQPNSDLTYAVKSPYLLKQSLINFNKDLKANLFTKSSNTNNANQNTKTFSDIVITNLI